MKMPASTLCRGLLATAFSFVLFTFASAADSFEGRIHMEISSGKKKEAVGIDYAIKEGKMRMDMPQESNRRGAGSGGIIIDYTTMEMYILMEHDGQKNYMRRSMAEAVAKASERTQDQRHTSVPVATGRTEVIAGYTAAEYTFTSDKGEVTEMWLAKGLGRFMGMSGQQNPMGRGAAPSPEWEKFARDGNLFPLRVVGHNTKGGETTRMEVTKIEKTSLPDSLFSTDGYTEFKIPDFGGLNPFKH
ncbi:MAG: hypothetical protein JWM35_1146 [Verrucomicrobia bacterium]|nr:hypothetical protein [Verrucomicrobiota bacterium]